MYISIYRLWQEEGTVYLYVVSVAETGKYVSLCSVCGRKRELYIYVVSVAETGKCVSLVYRLWQEEGNVYLYLPSVS